ncbi:MAG TPA: GAF domain-containing protein, partial [Vicinamibacterales bacterium]|nr:GAF domain-containing protein [Vicinamibacterales bacterium]
HEGEAALAAIREEHEGALAAIREERETELTTARTEAEEAAAMHSHAPDAQLAGLTDLLESVRALDGAASLPEVLDALTIAAAKEAGRSAMLVVKGDRLVGWRASGFGDLDLEPRSIESSTADVGALAAAVNTSRPVVVDSGSVLTAPAFSQLPPDRPGLAVPLLVGGRPVAVLYADAGATGPLSSAWTSPVEVLVRHAGRCLEAMAVARGAHAKATAARVGTPA